MKQPIRKNHFGWVPDMPDQRDHTYAAPQRIVTKLPANVDLRKKCPPVYNQGRIGSCTANAIGAAMQFVRRVQKCKPDFIPSRLFIYWNERSMERTVPIDNGAQIRDGIKVVVKLGVCPETVWTYDDTPADPNTSVWPQGAKPTMKPSKECFTSAEKHQALAYQRVARNLTQMKGCLASGFPFVIGFSVYDSFEGTEVEKTGQLNMPEAGEGQVGGHAVLVVGYNEAQQRFLVRNSWGKQWGMGGYFTMPYAYLLDSNLSDDFWTIRLTE